MKQAWKTSWPTITIIVAFFAFGVTMWLQPNRYANTPSYGNLMQLVDLDVWGTVYLVAAMLLALYIMLFRVEWFAIVAHTLAFVLSSVWLVAFVVRYATDSGTTIVNVVSWSVLSLLVVMSSLCIDEVMELT